MTQFEINAKESELTTHDIAERRLEMKNQLWCRDKSVYKALSENISLSDEHWEVIKYLRKNYLKQGTPRHARTLADDLNQRFRMNGGNKYLRLLFPDGPVTQGCRFANLHTPANATDVSFGTSY